MLNCEVYCAYVYIRVISKGKIICILCCPLKVNSKLLRFLVGDVKEKKIIFLVCNMHTVTVINHFDDVWIMYYFCAECHVIVSDNVKKVIRLAILFNFLFNFYLFFNQQNLDLDPDREPT